MLSPIIRYRSLKSLITQLPSSRSSAGYIVLLPEIGESACSVEALLKPDGLPRFNTIAIETCTGAIHQQALDVEGTVKKLESKISSGEHLNIDEVMTELDAVTGPLETTWGIAKALYLGNSTEIPTKTYLNIHERARNARASKFISEVLYQKVKAEYETDTNLEPAKKRLLEKYLLEGKLNGLSLSNKNKAVLRDVVSSLSKERAHFKNKVNLSINAFSHYVTDYSLIRDFPSSLQDAIAYDPSQPAKGPWHITLQPQIVENWLKHCPDRASRWNLWQANVRKASGQDDKNLGNSVHLETIRGLRKQQANLLGYPTFTAMSMQTKMIKSLENAQTIFTNLLNHAGPRQISELQSLQEFATASGFEHQLAQFDIPYWQRKYLRNKFDVNEDDIRKYFSLPKALGGLFEMSEELFDIKIHERKSADVWHPNVKYYDVYDGHNSAKPIAGFYLDCYSKENRFGKNSGWMVSIRNRNEAAGNTPLSALVFNFNEPRHGKPHLLGMDDLRVVFKTFGTALQHLLTRAYYSDLAGLSNIEWDASQICGEVLVNFLTNEKVLRRISGYHSNDEVIPDSLIGNIKQLKTSMAGYNLCEELYLSDLDLQLHESDGFWLDVVRKVWPVYHCLPLDKKDGHPCSMTDIFSGDWAAAYFSHLYSKVIAADVYEAFEEKRDNPNEIGKRFRDTFLASGGSVGTAEVFRKFRGRDPSVEALLKSLNLLKPQVATVL